MPDGRVHVAGADRLAAFQPAVQRIERDLRGLHPAGLAADRHPVAPAGQPHAKPLLQADQMAVMLAQQQGQQRIVGEVRVMALPAAAGVAWVRADAGDATIWFKRRLAPVLAGCGERVGVGGLDLHAGFGADQPGRAGHVHGMQPGRAPRHLAGMAAGAGEQHRHGQPQAGAVEGRLLLAQQRLKLAQPGVFLRLVHLPGEAAAGVPGRAE